MNPALTSGSAAVLFLCAVGVSAVNPALADDIVLRGSVRLPVDATVVRLGDVAELTGPEAQRLAALVLMDMAEAARPIEIDIDQVRAALTTAGAHWGRINLTGSRVIVRPRRDAGSAPPLAMAPAQVAGGPDRAAAAAAEPPPILAVSTAELVGRPDLRGIIADFIVDRLGVDPAQARLIFDPADAALLATADGNVRYELEPLSSLDGDRVEFVARAWSKGTIQSRHALTVRVQLRTEAAAPNQDIDRGQAISASMVDTQVVWLPPGQARAALGPRAAEGLVAARRIRAGELVHQQDARSPLIVRRGDRVMVRCMVGGVVIAVQAHALQDGAKGDRIELRKQGERLSFTATVSGPAEAVVDLRTADGGPGAPAPLLVPTHELNHAAAHREPTAPLMVN